MADIRDYLKEKEKREKQNGTREVPYTEKIHKHRLSSLYRMILIAAVVAAAAVILLTMYRSHVYETYDVLASEPKTEVMGITEIRFGKGMLTYSKDGAHCTDAKGKVLWNQTYEMQSPMVAVCGEVTALADYNGHRIYLYDMTHKLGEIDTTMPIRSVCVSATGVVAAVLDDSEVTWIRAFNAEGTVLVDFKTSMKNFGYPVSVSLSPNSVLCAVSYMYVDMGAIKTSIGFYNFGEVGKNQTDNFVGGYDHADTVVPFVQFMNNQTAFAAGDDRLVFYRGNQKPENAANILLSEEIQAVYYNEQYVGLVFLDGSGNGKRLDIYNTEGTKVTSHEFDMDYTDILFDNDNYIIYNETELYIGTMAGDEKYNGAFGKPVSLVIPTGTPYRYTVVTKDSVDVIRMR